MTSMTFQKQGSEPPQAPCRAEAMGSEAADFTAELMRSRQTILPKRLTTPGPDAAQWALILEAAATAPDHGQIVPWRFIVVPQASRGELAEVFGQALLERDGLATAEQQAQAREKAHRSPLLMLVVVDGARGDAEVDLFERMASAGCALQNMLLMATAQGFGSALTSGKALKSHGLRQLFGLQPQEHALCFVNIGSIAQPKKARLRPLPADFVSTLEPASLRSASLSAPSPVS